MANITHHHLHAVLNTELASATGALRILDMGCGNGHLISFLHNHLTLPAGGSFEVHGFDVADSAVQAPGFFADTIAHLNEKCPGVEWSERLRQITTRDPWPYPDESFDVILSNQVMEHVQDHDFVLGEIQRVLTPDGLSVHLFPLKHYVFEDHLKLPAVHWITNRNLLVSYIKFCSRLGLGRYMEKKRRSGGKLTLDVHAEKLADYMIHETNYISLSELHRCAKRKRLRCMFRYTGEFYRNRLRTLLGAPIRSRYSQRRQAALERLTFPLYVVLSSITLILEK
jgi:SAM-dependent methyltransferase